MFPQITEEPERRQAERFADRIPAGKRMAALKDLRRKAMKKYLIILLCIFLCVPSAWAIAKAVHIIRYTDGDFAFILLEDGTAEIRRYSGRDTFLEIPSKMKGHPVSGIGDKAFEWRFWMKEVTVPDGVCRIGTGAFSGCYSLETIRLPESLSSIGDRAFALCRELDAPVLPKKLASIGEEAFDGCSGLEKIELPSKDRTGIIIPKDHPLAGRKCIRAEDLRNLPLIMVMRSYMNKADYADQFGIPESELNIAATGNLIYNLAILAEHRIGAILSLEGLVHTGDDSELVFIPFEPKIERTLVLTWKQNRPLNRVAEVFLNTMREKIDEKL